MMGVVGDYSSHAPDGRCRCCSLQGTCLPWSAFPAPFPAVGTTALSLGVCAQGGELKPREEGRGPRGGAGKSPGGYLTTGVQEGLQAGLHPEDSGGWS